MIIRQSFQNVISAVFLTLLLTTFAWPVWTALKPMHHRLDEINVKMDVLQHSVEVFVVLVHVLASD
jgi:fumarate reductase subunit D